MTSIFKTVHVTDLPKPQVSVATRRYTQKDIAEHADKTSCWIIVHDKVYDITKFLDEHPGGYDVILEHAGMDATIAFEEKGHSKDALLLLNDYYIGDFVRDQ